MTNAEYVKDPRCPQCGSPHIYIPYNPDVGFNHTLNQPMRCEVCDKTWDSVYTLTGFEEQT